MCHSKNMRAVIKIIVKVFFCIRLLLEKNVFLFIVYSRAPPCGRTKYKQRIHTHWSLSTGVYSEYTEV